MRHVPGPTQRTVDTLPEAAQDYVLDYRGANGLPARCRVRAYHGEDGKIVVATELGDNPGPSVTNAAEFLHHLAWRNAGSPGRVTFVEHYPGWPAPEGEAPRPMEAEQADLVHFPTDPLGDLIVHPQVSIASQSGARFGEPRWQHLPLPQLRKLIDGPL